MEKQKVERVERGWAGHFICGHRCLFRRNTLLRRGRVRVVVSTVGNMCIEIQNERKFDTIGAFGRRYETMAFHAKKNGPYWDADVRREFPFSGEWSICAETHDKLPSDVDNIANDMHEKVVAEITQNLEGRP